MVARRFWCWWWGIWWWCWTSIAGDYGDDDGAAAADNYDDGVDDVDEDDLDKDVREGAILREEGGSLEADTNWEAHEADLWLCIVLKIITIIVVNIITIIVLKIIIITIIVIMIIIINGGVYADMNWEAQDR